MSADAPRDFLTLQAALKAESPVGAASCECVRPSEPCAFIIFGASGDLAARKILPALYRLYLNDYLPRSFLLLGCGRTDLSDADFRARIRSALVKAGIKDLARWKRFSQHLCYQTISYDNPKDFKRLASRCRDLGLQYKTGNNRLFYLAVPPFLYQTIAAMMGQAGLTRESKRAAGWSRIVVEKPFGSNLATAIELNSVLLRQFQEHQIYRIDHYLAKETIQNLLVFRFANAICEPLWNRQYIERVDICATEELGVEHRAGYYEAAGVLRDMFQNHMMQLVALIGMEPPAHFLSESVRDEKAKFFQSLAPFDLASIDQQIVLGQYAAGKIGGRRVPAYREEPGVDPRSLTPTFAAMKLFVDNWRWQGVPFYITSGKRLAQKLTQITIQFKDVPHAIFRNIISQGIRANRLTFLIQPSEKITLSFQAKVPGSTVCLRSINMEFSYEGDQSRGLEAYERVLIDCMNGDQMLFLRQDSEELCWSFLTPLIEDCEQCVQREKILHFYAAGAWGPEAAEQLRT